LSLPIFREHDVSQAFETALIKEDRLTHFAADSGRLLRCLSRSREYCRGGVDDEQGSWVQRLIS
jgi:hypothetical protein